ncbi:hypothetical protein J1614_003490 [Plenodomus biglobosus]|nr:hypothetical protein J1614_003490 [Plenodomus biglobosus]
MSEPSETSGCPLVPTILQLQQPDAGTVQQLASAHSESEASSPSPSSRSYAKLLTSSNIYRRHQKNHAQDGALLCDFPDCDKTFYRIDLLQRHQERQWVILQSQKRLVLTDVSNEPGRVSRHASTFSPDPEGSPEPRQSSAPENLPSNMVAVLPADPSFHTPQPASPVHESPTLTRYTTNLFRTPQLPRTVQAPTSTFNHVIHSSPSFVSPK